MKKITKIGLKKLIGQNKLIQVVEDLDALFLSYVEKNDDKGMHDFYDEIILFSNKINGINQEINLGIIDNTSANIEKSRICHGVLNLINKIPNQVFEELKKKVLEEKLIKEQEELERKDQEELERKIEEKKNRKEEEELEEKALKEKGIKEQEELERKDQEELERKIEEEKRRKIQGLENNFDKQLSNHLNKYKSKNSFYFGTDIPKKKMKNARRECSIPEDEEIIALVDATVFGSADNCFVFCKKGAYYHNSWSGKQPGANFIDYNDFTNRNFSEFSNTEINLDKGDYFDYAGSTIDVKDALLILEGIKTIVHQTIA